MFSVKNIIISMWGQALSLVIVINLYVPFASITGIKKKSKLWELFTVAVKGQENVCVPDAGRANQSIQQLSSTLQPHHSEERGDEAGQGLTGSLGSNAHDLHPPMDGDKIAWNQKAQSEAGISENPYMARGASETEKALIVCFLLSEFFSPAVFSQCSQSAEEPPAEAGQRNYLCSFSFNKTVSFQGTVEYAALNNTKTCIRPR